MIDTTYECLNYNEELMIKWKMKNENKQHADIHTKIHAHRVNKGSCE